MVASQRQPTGIVHFKVLSDIGLRDFLLTQAHSIEDIDRFLFRGCIYVDGLRTRQDTDLKSDQVVRLHTKPKSYQWEPGPLRERIVFDDPEFLVLDKPAGLPVHATLDNYVENAKFLLERELEMPLYSTHRLDIPTQGLLILAKIPAAQRVINKTFAARRVEKIYHAITETAVSPGIHSLYINSESRVPREHSFTPVEGWWECRMEILDCKPMTQDRYQNGPGTFCNRIRLITGKTHQIRAQLRALGAPILNDTVYGAERNYVPERLALECYSLSFTFRSRTLALTRPSSIALAPPPRLKDPELHLRT